MYSSRIASRMWFALGVAVALATAGVALGDDPYVTTSEYNTFPWHFESDYAYAFSISPLKQQPSPQGYPEPMPAPATLVGGLGLVVAIRYTKSPIEKYSELFYVPGNYKHKCISNDNKLKSINRIYVDSPYSMRAGRNIWGIPKELATFDWQEPSPGRVSLTVRNTTGSVVFEATMDDTKIPSPVTDAALHVVSRAIPDCLTSIQWPIDDNTNKTQYANVPVFATAQEAYASKPIRQVTYKMCIKLGKASIVTVKSSHMDAYAFTGHSDDQPSIIPVAARLPAGTLQGSLDQPAILQC